MSRTWKWVVFSALLLIVISITVGVIYVARLLSVGTRVDAEIARIRAAGEPTTAADLRGKPIPDLENAAVVYERAFKLLPKPADERESKTLDRFLDSEERAKDRKLWAQAREITRRYSAALPIAERAVVKPKCRFSVDWRDPLCAQFPHYRRLRFLTRLASASALLEARAGDHQAAAKSIALAYALSESLSDEPGLISALVRYAMIQTASKSLGGVCSAVSLSEADSMRIVATLSRTQLAGSLAKAYQGERAQRIIMFGQLRSGTKPGEPRGGNPKELVPYQTPAGRVWLDCDESYYLGEMRSSIDTAAMPYRSLRPHLEQHEDNAPRYAVLSTILLPVGTRTAMAQDRAIAILHGDRLFLGLLVYRGRFGTYPSCLDDLRKLNWQLPEDPFSGKPFIYKRQGRGFLLYSIGDDLKDNGGIEATAPKASPSAHTKWPGKPIESDIVWKFDK